MSEGETAAAPPVHAKRGCLWWAVYGLLFIATAFAMLTAACSSLLWLPDVIPPYSWKHVGGEALPNGESLHLFQIWGDDFYTTALAVKKDGRYRAVYVLDGDDGKQWRFDVRLLPESQQARVYLSPGYVFYYSWSSGKLSRSSDELSTQEKTDTECCGSSLEEFEADMGRLPDAAKVSP